MRISWTDGSSQIQYPIFGIYLCYFSIWRQDIRTSKHLRTSCIRLGSIFLTQLYQLWATVIISIHTFYNARLLHGVQCTSLTLLITEPLALTLGSAAVSGEGLHNTSSTIDCWYPQWRFTLHRFIGLYIAGDQRKPLKWPVVSAPPSIDTFAFLYSLILLKN